MGGHGDVMLLNNLQVMHAREVRKRRRAQAGPREPRGEPRANKRARTRRTSPRARGHEDADETTRETTRRERFARASRAPRRTTFVGFALAR